MHIETIIVIIILISNIILDEATSLICQQSGSSEAMKYKSAIDWINEFNNKCFAGFNDWRVPTLEEAMSLVENEMKNRDLGFQ